jgi:two-component system, cell cycle response regulator DivK
MIRLLYVEDNNDNAFMLQMRFELLERFALHVAVNGRDGIEAARTMAPDLILMDIDLPDLDGLEVTRRLKADAGTADIPIIAVTAHAMTGDREKALAAGCDEFDTKPVDFDRLLGKIEACLRSRRPNGT